MDSLWFECPHCNKPDTIEDDYYNKGDEIEVECRDCKAKITLIITKVLKTCGVKQ